MTTRRELLKLGAGLILTPASLATLASRTVGAELNLTAAEVVSHFLHALSAGNFPEAYSLLSIGSRQSILSEPRSSQRSLFLPPALSAVCALFTLIDNTEEYKFTLAETDVPGSNILLVKATSTKAAKFPEQLLKVVVISDKADRDQLRLDLNQSLSATDHGTVGSMSNLKQLALGIIQYTNDHDEKLPDADKWVDEIMPYVKTEAIFRDPSAPAGEKWSYAYNRNLSGVSLAKLDSPASTVMLFESKMGVKNANDTGESIPMPGRHQGGTDYAQSDGHVEWLADGTKLSFLLSGK